MNEIKKVEKLISKAKKLNVKNNEDRKIYDRMTIEQLKEIIYGNPTDERIKEIFSSVDGLYLLE